MTIETNKKKLLFLRVKEIKGEITNNYIYPSMDNFVEWIKERYARDCYWIKEQDFYDDVEIPSIAPSFDEQQTEEGQKKYWNWHLSELISMKRKGLLLDKAIGVITSPHESLIPILVVEILGRDMFFTSDDCYRYDLDLLELENVNEEYLPKFFDAINTEEIEAFVNTHTQDEIEEKYSTRFNKESEGFSMWEL